MNMDISVFGHYYMPGFGYSNKNSDRSRQPQKNEKGLLFSSGLTGSGDEFRLQAEGATNPFEVKEKNILQIYQPFRRKTLDSRVMFSKSLMNDTCVINNLASSLLGLIELKDPYTGSHSRNVQKYSEQIAKKIGLSDTEIEMISLGAAFHDIGKVGTPETLLKKSSKLNEEEYEEIKKHPKEGSKILENIPVFKGLIAQIVRHHHESWDGTGYPDRLSGNKIPLGARIVAITDSYHAMISDRQYRKGLSLEEASRRLKEGSGSHWDPELVKEFLELL